MLAQKIVFEIKFLQCDKIILYFAWPQEYYLFVQSRIITDGALKPSLYYFRFSNKIALRHIDWILLKSIIDVDRNMFWCYFIIQTIRKSFN